MIRVKTTQGFVVAFLILYLGSIAFRLRQKSTTPEPASESAADGSSIALDEPQAESYGRTTPHQIRPTVKGLLQFDQDRRKWIEEEIQLDDDGPFSASIFYHVLRAHGRDCLLSSREFSNTEQLIDTLLDPVESEKRFRRPSVVRTRYGLRFPTIEGQPRGRDDGTRQAFESHRDQCIATLGELGISLKTPILVDGQEFTLASAMDELIANFYLGQREIEWTAVALTLYLPPRKNWTNKLGETFTFDDLAENLLDRKSEKATCYGVHLFYAMTLLYRVDQMDPVLSPAVRDKLGDRLAHVMQRVVEAQLPSGAWANHWDDELRTTAHSLPATAMDHQESLLATGHLLEWMLYLPDELQPPRDVYARGAQWVIGEIEGMASDDRGVRSICPRTHCICALRQLSLQDDSLPEDDNRESVGTLGLAPEQQGGQGLGGELP